MGWSFFRSSWSSLACSGVSTTPGEIVLTRIPSATYSIAKARRNAGRVDLVRTGIEMGAPASGWSAKTVEMLTMWPDFCLRIGDDTIALFEKRPGYAQSNAA